MYIIPCEKECLLLDTPEKYLKCLGASFLRRVGSVGTLGHLLVYEFLMGHRGDGY